MRSIIAAACARFRDFRLVRSNDAEPKSQRKGDGENLAEFFRGEGCDPPPSPVGASYNRDADTKTPRVVAAGAGDTRRRDDLISPCLPSCSSPASIFSRRRRVASSEAPVTSRSPAKEPIIGNWISVVVRPPPRCVW